ncbi:ATP-binding protein [Thalassotalea maritima]|uniref:ATP-binding protein n=1 Tax=Thalassotalea maritima TaxID=3242416 RepID=UPI003526CFE8
MKLSRSFFTLYFLIIACFGVLSYALDELWSKNVEQDVESYTGYKTFLMAIREQLLAHNDEQWEQLVSTASQRYQLTMTLVDEADVETLNPSLQFIKGEDVTVYYDDDYVTLFLPIANSERVLILGPVQSPTRPKTEALVRVAILLLLAVVVFFWIWPVSRDLDRLAVAAKAFGDGEFNATVNKADSSLVQPLIETFNMMARRINHLIGAHKELTNAVSHELRTPLARSKFALQVLRSANEAQVREKYTDSIDNDICELETLVNELLMYASFDSQQPNMALQATDIIALVNYQAVEFADQPANVHIETPKHDVMVRCDPHYVNRAVANLLRNGIKYGRGEVRIKVSVVDGYCRIDVEDNGDGVDDSFKKIIFDPFSRFDQSRGKDTGGFGLGLAIVSKIMLWHKGKVDVSDSELGGARFSLYLPVMSA